MSPPLRQDVTTSTQLNAAGLLLLRGSRHTAFLGTGGRRLVSLSSAQLCGDEEHKGREAGAGFRGVRERKDQIRRD